MDIQTQIEKKLSDLIVGDKIFVCRRSDWKEVIVKRLTATLVIVDIPNFAGDLREWKFYKDGGHEFGSSQSYDYAYIKVWSEELNERIEQEKRYKQVFRVLPRIPEHETEKINRAFNFLKQEGLL